MKNKIEENNEQKREEVYALGIDLASDYAQISFFCKGMDEPKSVSTIPGENKYLIPTLMYKMKNVDEWYIGDEAKLRSYEDNDEKYVVRNLLERIYSHDSVRLDDMCYTEKDLLKIFMEKLLSMASYLENIGEPEYIAVTVENGDKDAIEVIYGALKDMGYTEDKISVLNHSESFIYYTLNQKRDIWINDVALFDFNGEHFTYRQLSIMRNRQPNIVTVKETDYSDDIDMSYLDNEKNKQNADEIFLEIIRKEFYKQIISSVFLTGVGFYSDFAGNSLVELCSKRRVFKGYNLFVKGACYAALAKHDKKDYSDYIFRCSGRTKVTIGMMINHAGRNTGIALSNAGTNWYEAGARAECILDNVKSVQIVLSSPYGNCSRNVRIDLSDFPDRPNKTTRVAITLAYINENQCDVMVEDLGFGEFFKATGMVAKESIIIDDVII